MDPSEILKILHDQWNSHGDLVLIDAPFRDPVVFIFDPGTCPVGLVEKFSLVHS